MALAVPHSAAGHLPASPTSPPDARGEGTAHGGRQLCTWPPPWRHPSVTDSATAPLQSPTYTCVCRFPTPGLSQVKLESAPQTRGPGGGGERGGPSGSGGRGGVGELLARPSRAPRDRGSLHAAARTLRAHAEA